MRKITNLTVLFFILLIQNLFSQQTTKVQMYTAYQKEGVSNQTLFSKLNAKSNQLQSFSYRQKYPGAKNPDLLKYYTLYIADPTYNPNNDSLFKSIFSTISTQETFVPLTECEFPATVNDPKLGWHLESVNAYCAWNITTGNPSVVVGVVDNTFLDNHEDMLGQFVEVTHQAPVFQGYHGTKVASTVAAKTNNSVGIASIGYNIKVRGVEVYYPLPPFTPDDFWVDIARGIWESYQAGDKIINLSWSGSDLNKEAVKEITTKSLLIFSAGNDTAEKNHYDFANIPGVIVVGGIKEGNKLWDNSPRHDRIDICAPATNIFRIDASSTYQAGTGTSLAAPMVAGTAALMLSVNRNLTPAQLEIIIKATADPITDGYLYEGKVGAGRLNAYRAVKLAQDIFSESFDLYIKDTPEDVGAEPNLISKCFYASEDIWVRNQPDGFTNQIHQTPEYDDKRPVYVYVKVRNKGCIPSKGDEKLHLYGNRAWLELVPMPTTPDILIPIPIIGSFSSLGALVATQTIPQIAPGGEAILQFEWRIPDVIPFFSKKSKSYNLLACIESDADTITNPNNMFSHFLALNKFAKNNNNVVQKNVSVLNNVLVAEWPGSELGIVNHLKDIEMFRLKFKTPTEEEEQPLIKEAEIIVELTEKLYQAWKNEGALGKGIKGIDGNKLLITEPNAYIDIVLDSEDPQGIYVGFNFLTQQISEKPIFKYNVELYAKTKEEEYIEVSGHSFIIEKWERDLFKANAGNEKLVSKNEPVELKAQTISEPVTYNWYNMNDSLLYTGKDFTTTTNQTQKYKLEVIAEKDGYKDYDEVTVRVKEFEIKKLSPNPTHSNLTVEYDAQNANTAYLLIYNAAGILLRTLALDTHENVANLDVSNYQNGSYTVVLVCNGQINDNKTFIVN